MRTRFDWFDMVVSLVVGAVLGFLLTEGSAHGATLVEKSIVCDPELTAMLEADGTTLHVYVQCATYAADGTQIRVARAVEITGKLTTQQRNGMLAILQAIPSTAAQAAAIPTPAPTP